MDGVSIRYLILQTLNIDDFFRIRNMINKLQVRLNAIATEQSFLSLRIISQYERTSLFFKILVNLPSLNNLPFVILA
jgi:hypothetical protein